jgi:hypothetical protein
VTKRKFNRPGDLRLVRAGPYTTLGHLRKAGGIPHPVSKRELIGRYKELDWRATFVALSRVACVIANEEDGPRSSRAKQMVNDSLVAKLGSSRLGRAIRNEKNLLIAHEESIHFAEAMALLYGRDEGGRSPDFGDVAWLLLAGNDYCSGWREEPEPDLTKAESLLAEAVRARRLNRYGIRHLDFLRSMNLFQVAPPRDPEWCEPEAWRRFQREAFGMAFEEYFETFAGFLAALSYTWGRPRDAGEFNSPFVVPSQLFKFPGMNTEKLIGAFSDLVLETPQVEARGDGAYLPIGPSMFSKRPFVEISEGTFAAASPWVVREHLRGGLWARHLSAARAGPGGPERWFSAFGDMYESWCRQKAVLAAEAGASDHLILSEKIGDTSEIEDIIFQDTHSRKRVALFSVKASMIPESAIKEARSPRRVVNWYERFLFARTTESHTGRRYREGVLRSLDATVSAIRSGDHEPTIPRSAIIYPVVVTYDDLGDFAALYRWARKRCNREGLLGGTGIRPTTFLSATDYEDLLEVACSGSSILGVLETKTQGTNAEARFDVILDEKIARLPGSGRKTRQELSAAIERLVARVQQPSRGDTGD